MMGKILNYLTRGLLTRREATKKLEILLQRNLTDYKKYTEVTQ